MRNTLFLALIAACLGLSGVVFAGGNLDISQENAEIQSSQGSKTEGEEIIAARVNGTDIPMQSVLHMMDRITAQEGRSARTPAEREKIRKDALDRVIFEELVYQKAKEGGMHVEPEEIEKTMTGLREQMGGDEALRKMIQREGLTEKDLRTDIERNIILQRSFTNEVARKVSVSEEEIEQSYSREKGKFVKAEKVVVIDTVFFLNPEERVSVEKAKQVRERILNDKDMNPGNLTLDGTFIVRDLEIKKEKQRELYAAARNLKPGELSGVIATDDSLHILKLKEYSPERQFSLSEMRGFLEDKLRTEAQQRRLKEWETELKKRANIEIMDRGE